MTAHEAAHQWWGNLLTPGEGPGGNILSEGMSHFSTILLTEQVLGEGHRITLAKLLESRYGDNRQVDSERPMVKTDGSRPGDTTVTYDKGGWVGWMLLNEMGRDNMLAGLREFIATFNPSPDHPVLQDLVATLRPHAPDPEAFDAFVEQWFFDVVVPEYRITGAAVDPMQAGGGPTTWRVRARIENVGTGRMPVQLAATRGVRFPEFEDDETPASSVRSVAASGGAVVRDAYREVRTAVVLGAADSVEIEIVCDFEPEQLIVDPDALVLQLRREQATASLAP